MSESRNLNKSAGIAIGPGLISEEAMVMTSQGMKPLGEIEEGDMLVTYDESTVMVKGHTRAVVSSGGRIAAIKIYKIGNPAFYISPNTLLMIDSWYCYHNFGSAKAFVRAASLRNDWLGSVLPGGEFVLISLCLQCPAMINVNGFVCNYASNWGGGGSWLGAGINSACQKTFEYPVLSDEEALSVFRAVGGAANVLSFIG